MSGTAKIVVAREDLSIPGSAGPAPDADGSPIDAESRFFTLLRENKPDVVMLDLRQCNGRGVEVISKVKAQSSIPIVVITEAGQADPPDYHAAGAADCIDAPFDILVLNQLLQRVIADHGLVNSGAAAEPEMLSFAGINLLPHQDRVTGPQGTESGLTTSETKLLSHFLSKPWSVCTREELGTTLYGRHRPNSDRAIDVIIARLRKKLVAVAGAKAQNLIKTEFRRGYMLVADVTNASTAVTRANP